MSGIVQAMPMHDITVPSLALVLMCELVIRTQSVSGMSWCRIFPF